MAKSSRTIAGGLGLCQLLTMLFVTLKLCDKIDWSWWWVLSPLWLPWSIAFAVMGTIGAVAVTIQVARAFSE